MGVCRPYTHTHTGTYTRILRDGMPRINVLTTNYTQDSNSKLNRYTKAKSASCSIFSREVRVASLILISLLATCSFLSLTQSPLYTFLCDCPSFSLPCPSIPSRSPFSCPVSLTYCSFSLLFPLSSAGN